MSVEYYHIEPVMAGDTEGNHQWVYYEDMQGKADTFPEFIHPFLCAVPAVSYHSVAFVRPLVYQKNKDFFERYGFIKVFVGNHQNIDGSLAALEAHEGLQGLEYSENSLRVFNNAIKAASPHKKEYKDREDGFWERTYRRTVTKEGFYYRLKGYTAALHIERGFPAGIESGHYYWKKEVITAVATCVGNIDRAFFDANFVDNFKEGRSLFTYF